MYSTLVAHVALLYLASYPSPLSISQPSLDLPAFNVIRKKLEALQATLKAGRLRGPGGEAYFFLIALVDFWRDLLGDLQCGEEPALWDQSK